MQLAEFCWTPWAACVDQRSDVRFVSWFRGALTSAAFNELDRFALRSDGGAPAFISDAADGGLGARSSLRQLLVESTLIACELTEMYGVSAEQRVGFYLPNDVHVATWRLQI